MGASSTRAATERGSGRTTTSASGGSDPGSRRLDNLVRHSGLVLVTTALLGLFWVTRLDWDPEMRLWRAVGDASIVLLFAVLALGPAARFSAAAGRLLPWRRQLGIWAALTAGVHTVLALDGWVRWDVRRFLGFEYVPQLGREVRLEPGFGLANLIGLVAMVWLVVLAATSTDRALRTLGPSAWKWLHTGAYTVFYLSVLHAVYFLFIHYAPSFHKAPAPENWFRIPLVVLGAIVLALQVAAFTRTVRRRRDRPERVGAAEPANR